jgi:hypothetical protein
MMSLSLSLYLLGELRHRVSFRLAYAVSQRHQGGSGLKYLWQVLLVCLLFTGASFGALAPACPGSSSDSGAVPLSVFSESGFACQQQDKAYSDFVVGAGFPAAGTVRFLFTPVGGYDFHTVAFSGNFPSAFTVSYTVTMDTTVMPGFIDQISGDLESSINVGNPTNVKTVALVGGAQVGTITSTRTNPGLDLPVNGLQFRITDTYTPNGGAAYQISNSFREVIVPEPLSMALAGSGLLLVGLGRLRRRKQ